MIPITRAALIMTCSCLSVETRQIVSADSTRTLSPLRILEKAFISTVKEDFNGHDHAFEDAVAWNGARLSDRGRSGAHVACADYGQGKEAFKSLEESLTPGSVHALSNHVEHGTCFIATASPDAAAKLAEQPAKYGLNLFFTLPSTAKFTPGLLDHGDHGSKTATTKTNTAAHSGRLTTTYGSRTLLDNVHGLTVALTPGFLQIDDADTDKIIENLKTELMSASVDLHAANFWSDPAMVETHRTRPEGAVRTREWTRAADIVHQLSAVNGRPSPGDICSWSTLNMHHSEGGVLRVQGLDHLLPGGRGAGGREGEESEELKTACFMSLLSYLASTPEVLHIAPLHRSKVMNAIASSVVQAASIDTADKPLTVAGLDGTGEVIQIIDTGLDETSCYFIDEDGLEVEHGYYFNEVGFVGSSSVFASFDGGDFPYDLTRRKIVQYVRLVQPDSSSQAASFYTTRGGGPFPWYSTTGFDGDVTEGHGTHTAGSAAGVTLNDPAIAVECTGTTQLGCVGGCLNASSIETLIENMYYPMDFDTWCPQYDCDGLGADSDACLDEDVTGRLAENGGVAQGAKLSIFDTSADGESIWPSLAGNGVWTATEGTDCMLHSNSWGGESYCTVTSDCILYDTYMYENPEHLLLFAAGNFGSYKNYPSRDGICTIAFPGIAKNVLTVGASSSSSDRLTYTTVDGNSIADGTSLVLGDMDTVAYFSSYGLTSDGRIKPEVVAPGDQVLSASSDGTDDHSCKLLGTSGTSMSTPIVAGAAAMIRQYFKDAAFYAADVNARGLCEDLESSNAFVCESFAPSAVTVKAMLVNSANLMGESSEPDGFRGFGRVHLEAGMPLDGEGNTALFVVDAADKSLAEYSYDEYIFYLDAESGLEFRSTLAWNDPPATTSSSVQLLNDLDLMVTSPSGVLHRMWSSGADGKNVIERVIVSADDINADNNGAWTVKVSSASLTTDAQSYSLVVTGQMGEGSGDGDSGSEPNPDGDSAAIRAVCLDGFVWICAMITAMVAIVLC